MTKKYKEGLAMAGFVVCGVGCGVLAAEAGQDPGPMFGAYLSGGALGALLTGAGVAVLEECSKMFGKKNLNLTNRNGAQARPNRRRSAIEQEAALVRHQRALASYNGR